jgi:hypothetical protein
MGGKIRDGEPGFNPSEKRNNIVIRVWGSTLKAFSRKIVCGSAYRGSTA